MPESILVVDDDEITQFVIVEMCRDLGFECETADDGRQALTKLTEEPHDICMVLMDIHMPGLSGIEAVSEIRAMPNDPPKQMPVVAVTADVGWHNPSLCQDIGFNSVLQKPLNIDLLSEALQRYSKCRPH